MKTVGLVGVLVLNQLSNITASSLRPIGGEPMTTVIPQSSSTASI